MSRRNGTTKQVAQAVQPRMYIYRSKSVPAAYATELLRNGTLLKHVQDHIARHGESKTNEYNVKVSGSGYIMVGARTEENVVKTPKCEFGKTIGFGQLPSEHPCDRKGTNTFSDDHVTFHLCHGHFVDIMNGTKESA